jgi:mono/diheme cytochrome c family protein
MLSKSIKIGLFTSMAGALAVVAFSLGERALASEDDEAYHRDYIYGAPSEPSGAWVLAKGGRLYDNWFSSLDVDKPDSTHPLWPASNTKKEGAVTWRCKSCHGWDYSGADGAYGKGSYKTGIKGVRAYAGKDPSEIHQIIMSEAHGYTHDMIPKEAMLWIAAFVSQGQVDVSEYIKPDKTVLGDPERGKALFQNICASCHGFDGRAFNWGDEKEPGYVGTEAQANPWEVLHKIRAGHPGVEMPALMALPIQDQVDVLSYSKTLPAE